MDSSTLVYIPLDGAAPKKLREESLLFFDHETRTVGKHAQNWHIVGIGNEMGRETGAVHQR